MNAELLHLVAAEFRPDVAAEERERAAGLAGELAGAEGVAACVVGLSESTLIAAAWLDEREGLDAFASAPEHMRFVLEGVGRTTTGMWSASIALPAATSPPAAASALWAFALPAEPAAFEWQAQELLAGVAALAAGDAALAAFAGPTVEERERFRAGGVVLANGSDGAALTAHVEAARAGWGPLGEGLQTAGAPVVAVSARAGSGR
jgi:hypothetical protein